MKLKVTCSRGEPGEPALLYSQRLCSPLITARVPSTGGHHSHQGYIRHGYTDSTASPCCSVTDHILQYVMIRNGLTQHEVSITSSIGRILGRYINNKQN